MNLPGSWYQSKRMLFEEVEFTSEWSKLQALDVRDKVDSF